MNFQDLLKENKVVLLDGAMGTELAKRGLERPNAYNLSNPDCVLEIHRAYIEAGAQALITNTFTMNRINLQVHGLDVDVKEVNLAGAKLARQAAGKGKLVFGDISPTGQLLKPYGDYSKKEFYDSFREQAEALVRGGVDGLIIETMFDLQETICALEAIKDITNLPVLVSMAFLEISQGGRTLMGHTVKETVRIAEEYGVDAVGANCGELDPIEMAEIAKQFRSETSLPVIVQPNAGKPVMQNNQTVFEMKPKEFADGILKCIDSGANIIGGCCGTGPDHIRQIAQRLH